MAMGSIDARKELLVERRRALPSWWLGWAPAPSDVNWAFPPAVKPNHREASLDRLACELLRLCRKQAHHLDF